MQTFLERKDFIVVFVYIFLTYLMVIDIGTGFYFKKWNTS